MLVTVGVAGAASGVPALGTGSGTAQGSQNTGDSEQTIGSQFSSGSRGGPDDVSGPGGGTGDGKGGVPDENDNGGDKGGVADESDSGGGGGTAGAKGSRSADTSSLPFTGISILILALVGTGLLAGGLLLRRRQTPA